MRTTINIDAALLTELRLLAAQRERAVDELIDEALRAMLARHAAELERRPPVALATDGGSGLQRGVDLEDKEALAELVGDNHLLGRLADRRA
jgi:plasmid stability protein